MNTYKYKALPGADFIRVLSVRPVDSSEDEIHCSMQAVSINSDTEYAALSYTWGLDESGDSTFRERIVVDGCALPIGTNLFQGLRRIFRERGQMLPIWIDAVCIDQSNIDERNAQVGRMAEIYACASQVIVWLGEGTDAEDNARLATLLDCLSRPNHVHYGEHRVVTPDGSIVHLCLAHAGIAAASALNNLRTSGTNVPPDDFPRSLPPSIQGLFEMESLVAATNELQRLLTGLTSKRYWTRRWIVQELFHANHNEVYFHWADQVISLRNLQSALRRIPSRFGWYEVGDMFDTDLDFEADGNLTTATNRLKSVLALPDMTSPGMSDNMLAWGVQSTNGYDCSDPRDRVYSLLSMDPKTTLRPDYSLAPEDVYISFCADLIADETYLPGMLYRAGEQKTQGQYKDALNACLPSWCLDIRETFNLPPKMTVLGDCSVNKSGQLKCSALVLGILDMGCTNLITGNDDAGVHIDYLYSHRRLVGDLVCVFHDMSTLASLSTVAGIILQAAGRDSQYHRIVGVCTVRGSSLKPHDYRLRNVCIC